MSFLSNNNAEFLSVRITQKGRNSIAQGNFKVSYFQIGDSEYDYSDPFYNLDGLGGNPHQKVFAPLDKNSGIKYPYLIDNSSNATTYGIPIMASTTDTIRNPMGPAGFVSDFKTYDALSCTGTTVECATSAIPISGLTGTNQITVSNGAIFNDCKFITLVFSQFIGSDPHHPVISGKSSSLIYQITNITGNTLTLDRNVPKLSGCTGNAQVICNSCENEFPITVTYNPSCQPAPIDTMSQLNSWTLNVVWGDKPIGWTSPLDESLSGFTSNQFISTKEYLGYTQSSGQSFTNLTGGTLTYPTSYLNSHDEQINVTPEQQRTIAIIHYSELGDLKNDPERFYKYDDYISTNNTTILPRLSVNDLEYFEVYIPFIQYHRNTSGVIGALFTMDTIDYYIQSTINPNQKILFRYLLDEQNNKVGKILVNNKTIIIDDQELVAVLDYKSNRRYTLPSPKINLVPSDVSPSSSFYPGSTTQTVWMTYMFNYTGDTQLNGLPCNYYTKFDITTGSTIYSIPCQLFVNFGGNYFSNMLHTNSPCDATKGFIANKLQFLIQTTPLGELPLANQWITVDMTSYIPGHTVGNLIDPTHLSGVSFMVNYTMFDSGTIYNIEDYMGYMPKESDSLIEPGLPEFGDEQPFPGSIKLVRATDFERMNFLVNLPSTQFNISQNPTYSTGKNKRITEIALLDDNKQTLAIGKTANPVQRVGTQVFGVKLDF